MASEEKLGSNVIEQRGMDASGRVRRSTLERFNDEMSVLDRPLEVEVEYYDEEPRSPWPKRLVIGAAMFLFSGGAGLVLARNGGAATPAAAIAAMSPAPAPAPVTPAAPAPEIALAPIEAAGDDGDDGEVVDAIPFEPSVATALAPSAWSKIGSQAARSSGHTKRGARLASHKTSQRHKQRHR